MILSDHFLWSLERQNQIYHKFLPSMVRLGLCRDEFFCLVIMPTDVLYCESDRIDVI